MAGIAARLSILFYIRNNFRTRKYNITIICSFFRAAVIEKIGRICKAKYCGLLNKTIQKLITEVVF
jgi:hypothetical protein